VISTTENSNKVSKTRFLKEKSVEDMVTLEGLPFNSSMISFHIWLFKKSIHTLQNNVYMLSSPNCNWFTLGANGTSHTTHYDKPIKNIEHQLDHIYWLCS
jgi:hypothetical protein